MRSTPLLTFLSFSSIQALAYTFEPLQHLAGITPYFESQTPPFDPAPPQGCSITRAAYLVRHAAIVANDFDYEEYIEPFVKKLANTTVDWSKAGNLTFLATWKSPIKDDQIEDLTQVGVEEATNLGMQVKSRYSGFRAPQQVWTSTAERTVKSAESFITGYGGNGSSMLVQIDEGKQSGANSLTAYNSCPAYSGSRGSDQAKAFRDVYTPSIVARFNAVAPAFNFTAKDVVGMQQLCGYETVINGNLTMGSYGINSASPFCSLDVFSANEWLGFEYMNDIMYHHSVGYGLPEAGVIGFPWTKTSANLLLQNNSAPQDLYVSFTHRELPPTVLVALGLFNNSAFSASSDVNATMPTDKINPQRAWISSRILPFMTNIAMERLECNSYNYTKGDYYRILVNQVPTPIPACEDGPGLSCGRASFTNYLQQRQNMFGGFSKRCGVKYSNSTDALSIYGLQADSIGNGTSGSGVTPVTQQNSGAHFIYTRLSLTAVVSMVILGTFW